MSAMDFLMMALLFVVAGVGLFLYSRYTKKPTAGTTAAAGAGEPVRDDKATDAFVRKLKSSAWKRELPVVVPDPEKSPFCALLVSPSGVTAFYSASYIGTVYGGPDPQWAQIENGVRRPFRSPLLAAEDARKALRDGLSAAKFGAFMVNTKVVMTAPKAELVIPRNTPTLTVKQALHDVEYAEELMANRRVDEAALKKYLEETYC